ncbi:MAG: ATPase [Proteobacteria bacterium]|nr:ATPase [Pseudomonadota bacterium]
MKIHQFDTEDAPSTLHTLVRGLTQQEAKRRLREYGPNRIEEVRGESLWVAFIKVFAHFFALILWLAAGLAFFAESRQPGQGMANLGYAMLGVILINGLFSFCQQFRAVRAISALRQLLPQHAKA